MNGDIVSIRFARNEVYHSLNALVALQSHIPYIWMAIKNFIVIVKFQGMYVLLILHLL